MVLPRKLTEPVRFEAKLDTAVAHAHEHDPAVYIGVEEWPLVVSYREHRLSALFDPAAPFEDVVDKLLLVGMPETSFEFQVPGKRR